MHTFIILLILSCVLLFIVSALAILVKTVKWIGFKGKVKFRAAFISLVMSALMVGFGVHILFHNIDILPSGTLVSTTLSPTKQYSIKLYEVSGGAPTSIALRGELNWVNSRKHKNIYWSYRDPGENVTWVDDDMVEINGYRLHVPDERYDYRSTMK